MNIFQAVVICTAVVVVAASDFEEAGKAIDDRIAALEHAGDRAVEWARQKANATVQFVVHAPERLGNAVKNAGKGAVIAVGKVGENTGNWIARQGEKVKNAAGGPTTTPTQASNTTPKPGPATTSTRASSTTPKPGPATTPTHTSSTTPKPGPATTPTHASSTTPKPGR